MESYIMTSTPESEVALRNLMAAINVERTDLGMTRVVSIPDLKSFWKAWDEAISLQKDN